VTCDQRGIGPHHGLAKPSERAVPCDHRGVGRHVRLGCARAARASGHERHRRPGRSTQGSRASSSSSFVSQAVSAQSLPRERRGQLGPRADAKLAVDLGQAPLDRLGTQPEASRDLVVREAARDELGGSPLGIGQFLDQSVVLPIPASPTIKTPPASGRAITVAIVSSSLRAQSSPRASRLPRPSPPCDYPTTRPKREALRSPVPCRAASKCACSMGSSFLVSSSFHDEEPARWLAVGSAR